MNHLCTELHLIHKEIIKIFLFFKIFRTKGINSEVNTQSPCVKMRLLLLLFNLYILMQTICSKFNQFGVTLTGEPGCVTFPGVPLCLDVVVVVVLCESESSTNSLKLRT